MSSKSIPLVQLTQNGPKVPALGLGLMGLSSGGYGALPSDEERFAMLNRAYELGNTFWDTADLYGDSEELVGKWFKRTGKRDEIFLATKFGYIKGSGTHEIDSSYEYCKKACAQSLTQLGVDCIDLYYIHKTNPNTPIEQTMRAMAELKAEGKIKHIGLSTVTSAAVRRAVKIAPVTAVQIEYSPFSREVEGPAGTHLLATLRELKITVVACMPLGRGIITSQFAADTIVRDETDIRTKVMPRFLDGNREKNVQLVTQFKGFADKKGCSASQLALAWLRKQGNDLIAIPGTRRVKYMEENWASLDINLTDDEEAKIRRFVEFVKFAGSSVPPQYEGFLYAETVEEA